MKRDNNVKTMVRINLSQVSTTPGAFPLDIKADNDSLVVYRYPKRKGLATYKRKIKPIGKNTIAAMIPQGPYLTTTSWSPRAQRANTSKGQQRVRCG